MRAPRKSAKVPQQSTSVATTSARAGTTRLGRRQARAPTARNPAMIANRVPCVKVAAPKLINNHDTYAYNSTPRVLLNASVPADVNHMRRTGYTARLNASTSATNNSSAQTLDSIGAAPVD